MFFCVEDFPPIFNGKCSEARCEAFLIPLQLLRDCLPALLVATLMKVRCLSSRASPMAAVALAQNRPPSSGRCQGILGATSRADIANAGGNDASSKTTARNSGASR